MWFVKRFRVRMCAGRGGGGSSPGRRAHADTADRIQLSHVARAQHTQHGRCRSPQELPLLSPAAALPCRCSCRCSWRCSCRCTPRRILTHSSSARTLGDGRFAGTPPANAFDAEQESCALPRSALPRHDGCNVVSGTKILLQKYTAGLPRVAPCTVRVQYLSTSA